MSVESEINQIAQSLRNAGLKPVKTSFNKRAGEKPNETVAESWEDEDTASDGGNETTSLQVPRSGSLEAPGPTHLKSPSTRAFDAQKELDGDTHNLPDVPPPTPISPALLSSKSDWSASKSPLSGRPAGTPVVSPNVSSPRYVPSVSLSNPASRHDGPDAARDTDRRRPEKTTATANRLIAGALGIKTPPKTEEQRQYEKAVKEQEIKRKNKEKEQKARETEEDEKAKAAVWDS